MKTPKLKELIPNCFAVTANSLALALQDRPAKVAAATLKILKEASIRDQNFEQACTFRSAHKALQGAIKAAKPA